MSGLGTEFFKFWMALNFCVLELLTSNPLHGCGLYYGDQWCGRIARSNGVKLLTHGVQ